MTNEISNLEKLGLGSIQLLRMIPRIVSDTKPERKNIHRVFLQSYGNTRVKMISLNIGSERNFKCFVKRSGSFPRVPQEIRKKHLKFSQ